MGDIPEIDLVKMITGKTLDELTSVPTYEDVAKKELKIIQAGGRRKEVFSIGHQKGVHEFISEGEREAHMHIIGAPGQGKSKFLEYLIRHDIDRLHRGEERACGLCLIDPSARGGTINKVLAYCESIGFKKVLLIDPLKYHSTGKVAGINPFKADRTYWTQSTDYLVDAFRILFEVADPSRTAYITTYLTALFSIFHYTGMTATELIPFTIPFDKTNEGSIDASFKREDVYNHARKKIKDKEFPGFLRDIAEKHLTDLELGYKNTVTFDREVGSTARRLNQLVTNPYLRLIFGHRDGVNFDKVVSKGWVVLVNASTGQGLGILQSRLLATIVINQIIQSIERLQGRKFKKSYYLYIDEAGQYVTHKLADILAHKRQIGLRTILAHQYLGQLKDEIVREAIINCTGIKCGFYIQGDQERNEVVGMLGYGGDLKKEDVAYNLGLTQEKQQMVVKLGKKPPVVVKVPDTPDIETDVDSFVEELFQSPWYYTLKDINDDERKRLPVQNTKSSKSSKKAGGKTAGKDTVPPGVRARRGKPEKDVPPGDEKPKNDGGGDPIII